VQYIAIPVFSNKHIEQELKKIEDNIETEAKFLKSLLFINCGGSIDMTSKSLY
jgi:hypothetical protein